MVPVMVHLLVNCSFDLKKEAAFSLLNMTLFSHEQILPLFFQSGGLIGFLDLLLSFDEEMVRVALTFVEFVLRRHELGVGLVEREGGVAALESVSSSFPLLCDVSNHLIDEFFPHHSEP